MVSKIYQVENYKKLVSLIVHVNSRTLRALSGKKRVERISIFQIKLSIPNTDPPNITINRTTKFSTFSINAPAPSNENGAARNSTPNKATTPETRIPRNIPKPISDNSRNITSTTSYLFSDSLL